jgi:hypothetical protein
VQVTASVQTDITEALYNEGFVAEARGHADHAHVSSTVDEVFNAMEDALSERFGI